MPELRVNGQPVRVPEGASVLAALGAAGALPLHPAPDGSPRAPLCGMGSCQDCRAWVDGVPVTTCLTRAQDGMQVETGRPEVTPTPQASRTLETELLVVGAGPAGLEGALAAASGSVQVLLLDAGPGPGGQIWRGARAGSGEAGALVARVQADPHIRTLAGASVAAVLDATPDGFRFLVVQGGAALTVRARRVLLATGALERFLPFPGWTLPGVTGAGALQVMAKDGLNVRGQRMLVAGSGPLLLAVAAGLRAHGARVLAIAEQAPVRQLAGFGAALARDPGRARQAAGLGFGLAGVPYWLGSYPVEAHGAERLEAVTVQRGARRVTLPVDRLAVGFGLVPETRLARALGCAVTPDGAVIVNAYGLTSVPGVFAAGEVTGVAGAPAARAGGRVAGLTVAGRVEALPLALAARAGEAAFAAALDRAFALRPELRDLPAPDTTVCRCEAVPHAALAPHAGWREAKLHTRCGMGACQGRVCAPATQHLYGWPPEATPRAPLQPIPVQALLTTPSPLKE